MGLTPHFRVTAVSLCLLAGAWPGSGQPRAEPTTAETVAVRVVDGEGQAVAGARVRVLSEGTAPTDLVTDADGSVVLDGAAGSIEVLAPGRVDGIRVGGTSPVVVTLPPSQRRRIEVRGAEGEPLEGMRVRLADDGWTVGITDERGRLELGGRFTEPVRLRVEGGSSRLPAEVHEVILLPPLPGAPADASPEAVRVPRAEAEGRPAGSLAVVLPPGLPAFGRILDLEERPLEAATVVLTPAERAASRAGEPIEVTTDAAGRFLVPAVAWGSFDLTADAAGFAPATLRAMELPEGSGPADLGSLLLQPGVEIDGRVVDLEGAPVAAAELRFREAVGRPAPGERVRLLEGEAAAVADEAGRFVVEDLAPGRPVDLLASGEGFLPVWTLAVEAPPAEPLVITLEPAARLSGRVVDPDERGIADAAVTVTPRGSPEGTVGVVARREVGGRSTTTDEEGQFEVDGLAPGLARVEASAQGYLAEEPAEAELPLGGAVEDIEIVLRRGAVIEGTVSDPTGAAVSGADLRAGPARDRSAADGSFRLVGLDEGFVGLFTYHSDYKPGAQEVEVRPGTNRVEVVLEDGFTLAGRTVDQGGRPIAGVRVQLHSESLRAGRGYQVVSEGDGAFRAVVGEAGRYRLVALREGFAPRQISGVELGPVPVEDLEVVMGPGAAIVGQILGLELDDLATVQVVASRDDLGEVHGTVDYQGRYRVDHLLPGDWRLRAQVAGGRRQATATVAVTEGQREVERDLDLGDGVTLSGTVSTGGEPIPAAHVVLTGLTVTAERSVATGYDGSFRIEDLDPGRYRLDVLDPSRALSHLEDLDLDRDRRLDLDLESAPLTGRVLDDATGEPIYEALVSVVKILPTGETGSMIVLGTDPSGSFTIAHLTPGPYRLSARKEGYTPVEESLEMSASGPASQPVLRLPAAGGLGLQARLDTGEIPGLVTLSAFTPEGDLLLTDTKPLSDNGRAHFSQLPAGRWSLLVSTEGAAAQWAEAEVPGAVQLVMRSAAPLTVRVPPLMDSGGSASLTILGADGQAFFQVQPGGEIRSRWTVAGGVVVVPNVPAGVWRLQVVGSDGPVWAGQAATDGRTPVEVSLR